ncbi:Acetylcholine receptor subunit alpha-type unc-38 [Aphelenchoides besseyi]|nr:Acetylcholine receptor subunit alpha-type unc-38 [Aphelenchoides besseyi]KAI6210919.1 Acetylcholine receptor subunit alpha-type unc-38 [Aphelenchoides besseyi]
MINRLRIGFIQLFVFIKFVEGIHDSKRLFDDLIGEYNSHRRPGSPSEQTIVHLRLSLSQIIDVDELNQVMVCSVWLRQTWFDHRLQWNESNYGGIDALPVPVELLWAPDLVLYNAETTYNVTISTKATIHSTGRVVFEPPAILRSTCQIDVRFYPFDDQICSMKFGSWSYPEKLVDLKLVDEPNDRNESANGVDISEYYPSVEWDIMTLKARRSAKHYRESEGKFVDMTFELGLRRKSLFYTLNLLVPCISMAFLTLLVFYLPSESGEKVQLSISILVSVVFFFLLLTEMLPASGFSLPLIAKYLLFTMLLASMSAVTSIVVLSLHFRQTTTNSMSSLTRWFLLVYLPPILGLRKHRWAIRKCRGDSEVEESDNEDLDDDEKTNPTIRVHIHRIETSKNGIRGRNSATRSGISRQLCRELARAPMDARLRRLYYSPVIIKAIENIDFIGQILKKKKADEDAEGELEYAAAVLDRLFLWIFGLICIVGTIWIFAYAPVFYDNRLPYDLATAPIIQPLEEVAWRMDNYTIFE